MNEKLGMAMRDKYWNERNTDEKVAALHQEVSQLRYQLTTALSLIEKLLMHSHADGKVVVPLDRNAEREYYLPVALQNNLEKKA
jgi:hypothetical protein